MEFIFRPAIVVLIVLAGVLLFTPYEAFLEGAIAIIIVVAAVLGFSMHPRREVYYVRTAVRLIDADRNQALERDFLAVRVQLARLWLLFVPTFLSVAILVFLATSSPVKFSYLNWIMSSRYEFFALGFCMYAPLFVLLLLTAWIGERRVMRDAQACSARSFSVSDPEGKSFRRVSYLFMGEHGEYYGGDCVCFGMIQPHELATIVFHNVRRPELNKIAMGFFFHRLVVLGRGVTDLDMQTAASQTALAEMTSPS